MNIDILNFHRKKAARILDLAKFCVIIEVKKVTEWE